MDQGILYQGPVRISTPTILIVTWNANHVYVCGSMKKSFRCTIPNFMQALLQIIESINPVILVIGFQEVGNSKFHKELLPKALDPISYSQLDYNSKGRLHTSVYLRDDNYIFYNRPFSGQVFKDYAIGTYLELPNKTRLAIVNMQLPKINIVNSIHDPIIERDALAEESIYFNQAYRNLVLDKHADSAIVIGANPKNQRIYPMNSTDAILYQNYQKSSMLALRLVDRVEDNTSNPLFIGFFEFVD